jgi:nicotinate (nicotinamide) nucleotide adenylyltransferase
MTFRRKATGGATTRLAILSGAFHPPTEAHLALARAALCTGEADEVLLVLPRAFPHKQYERVSLEQRLELLDKAVGESPGVSIGVSEGGLFIAIARECRACYGGAVRLRFLCGRDAAERIVGWDYEGSGQPPIEEQLQQYELLVAPRDGVSYVPPPSLLQSIGSLPFDAAYQDVSSTAVRERIERGLTWEHLVPEAIRGDVAQLYRG